MASTPPHSEHAYLAAVRRYRSIEALLPSHWSEGFVQANGLRHHYYRTGGGTSQLVLLHGFQESALCWLRVAKALQEDYDLVLLDARGHGLSDRAGRSFTSQVLTADVAGVIQALKLERPHLLGFSLGSETALQLAATFPALVQTVIVSGRGDQAPRPQQFVDSPGYRAWYQSFVDYLKALKTRTHEERLVAALRMLPPGAPLLPEEEYVPQVEAAAHLDLDLVLMGDELWSQAGARYEETRLLQSRITCPVLLMYSEHFPTPGASVTLREEPGARPNERIVRFEHAGHLIYREHCAQFVEVVRAFLSEHRSLPAADRNQPA
ncbi:MAG TPA: alpha/beta hydrolase [Ktedonobacteraceae bacterium]